MSVYGNLAIFVTTCEESRNVQEELFAKGLKWHDDATRVIDFYKFDVVRYIDKGNICWTTPSHFYSNRYNRYRDLNPISYEEFMVLVLKQSNKNFRESNVEWKGRDEQVS